MRRTCCLFLVRQCGIDKGGFYGYTGNTRLAVETQTAQGVGVREFMKAKVLDRRPLRDKFQIDKMQTAEYRVLTE